MPSNGTLKFLKKPKKNTNNHDIIVTEAFHAALFRVKKLQQVNKEVKARALYGGLNKVDADCFNRNDVTVNLNTHWSAHHLHLELHLDDLGTRLHGINEHSNKGGGIQF